MEKKDYKLIEDFFDQELTEDQIQEVFKKAQNDPEFKKELYRQKAIIEGIREQCYEDLKEKFRQWDEELDKRSSNGSFFTQWGNMAAAVIVIMLVSVVGVYFFLQPAAHEQTFNEFYEPYPNVAHIIDRQMEELGKPERQPFIYYEAGQYERAYEHFESFLKEHPDHLEARFYKALSALEINKPDKAIEEFEKVGQAADEDFMLLDQTYWYMALAKLKNNQQQEAIDQLKDFSFRDHVYKDKSTELLEKLESSS